MPLVKAQQTLYHISNYFLLALEFCSEEPWKIGKTEYFFAILMLRGLMKTNKTPGQALDSPGIESQLPYKKLQSS